MDLQGQGVSFKWSCASEQVRTQIRVLHPLSNKGNEGRKAHHLNTHADHTPFPLLTNKATTGSIKTEGP